MPADGWMLLLVAAMLFVGSSLLDASISWVFVSRGQPMCARLSSRVGMRASVFDEVRALTTAIKGTRSPSGLLQVLQGQVESPNFNYFHIGSAFSQMGRFRFDVKQAHVKSPVWKALKVQTLKAAGLGSTTKLDTPGLVIVVWAIGELFDRDAELLELLGPVTERLASPYVLPKLDPETQMTLLVWAAARLKGNPQADRLLSLLPTLCDLMMKKSITLTPKGFSSTAWGIAECQYKNGTFLQAFANATVKKMHEWPEEEYNMALPRVVAAFAKLKAAPRALLDAVVKCTQPALMKDWHAHVLFWSFTELNITERYPDYFQKVTREVERWNLGPEAIEMSRQGADAYIDWKRSRGITTK